jgi:hypothetical protein
MVLVGLLSYLQFRLKRGDSLKDILRPLEGCSISVSVVQMLAMVSGSVYGHLCPVAAQ